MDNVKEIMAKLQEPFAPEEIEWRVGATTKDKTKGMALAFVTNRAIQNRLDDVFGCFGWKNEYREWRGNSQLCGISIKFGDEWITKWDGADNTDYESTKGGLSDSMKRAAYQWGIGRYLYKLDPTWVSIKQQGKSYVINGAPPELPDWALPDGYQKPSRSQNKPSDNKPGGTSSKTENEIGRVQVMNAIINIAKGKGLNLSQLNKGVAHYFPGKNNIADLNEDELQNLMNKVNAMEDNPS